jgi:hypothetical protein
MTKTKRTRSSETKVIRDKQSCMMVIPGRSALRCYIITEVITRAYLAQPNIAKKQWDVKTTKIPLFVQKLLKLTETSIDFVCENRNIQRTILFDTAMVSSSNKTVFLTGSTGFIGSRVVEILCQKGWNVRAIVRNVTKARGMFESWQPTTPGSVECIEGDLFAGSPADRTKLFVECLAGANAAIHIAEAKTKEKDFDAKNIKNIRPSS